MQLWRGFEILDSHHELKLKVLVYQILMGSKQAKYLIKRDPMGHRGFPHVFKQWPFGLSGIKRQNLYFGLIPMMLLLLFPNSLNNFVIFIRVIRIKDPFKYEFWKYNITLIKITIYFIKNM